jgi:hypothetical protein
VECGGGGAYTKYFVETQKGMCVTGASDYNALGLGRRRDGMRCCQRQRERDTWRITYIHCTRPKKTDEDYNYLFVKNKVVFFHAFFLSH